MQESITPTLRWIAEDILIREANQRPSQKMPPQRALQTILNTPNWQEEIKKWYRKNPDELQSKEAISKAIPLALAIFSLAQQTQAATPQELISEIKDKAKQTQIIDITSSDIQKMKKTIPFPVSDKELRALKSPFIPITMGFFERALKNKIEEGLRKKVFPAIEKDSRFSQMSPQTLSKLIYEGFAAKIHDPKYKDAKDTLVEYLKGKSSLDKVKDIARKKIQDEVNVALK